MFKKKEVYGHPWLNSECEVMEHGRDEGQLSERGPSVRPLPLGRKDKEKEGRWSGPFLSHSVYIAFKASLKGSEAFSLAEPYSDNFIFISSKH